MNKNNDGFEVMEEEKFEDAVDDVRVIEDSENVEFFDAIESKANIKEKDLVKKLDKENIFNNNESHKKSENEEHHSDLKTDFIERDCASSFDESDKDDLDKDNVIEGDSVSTSQFKKPMNQKEIIKNEEDYADYVDEERIKLRDVNLEKHELEKLRDEILKLKEEANKLFKSEECEEAFRIYTKALRLCPLSYSKDRAILYGNRAACRMKIEGEELSDAIADCDKSLELDPSYVRVLIRRAQLHMKKENYDDALKDYQNVLQYDPSNLDAQVHVRRLPGLINERNEKMKAEMLANLKNLGNMVLNPFGLSTDNFKLNQNSDGGYNISFQK